MLILVVMILNLASLNFAAHDTKEFINSGWKFIKGDPAGSPEQISYDDSKWASISIPHCFNIPWFINDKVNFGGKGWYRKHFTVSDSIDTLDNVYIEFEGVFQHCWVYVNGKLVGEHKGGYTGFEFDITKEVKFKQQDNVLAVKVSGEWDATIAPRAGDHIFTAGIYRDVYLVTKFPVHVKYNGLVITTPFDGNHTSSGVYDRPLSFDKAKVNVKIEVENNGPVDQGYYNNMEVYDANGTFIMEFDFYGNTIYAGEYDTIIDQEVEISNPHFWSPSDPYLYKLRQEIMVGCVIVDENWYEFGIRWFQHTANDGFYLNGKKLYLRGLNVHQDHAGWASAVTNGGHYRDVKICKDAGANFIRGSHYPKDPAFVKACDELGMLFMPEMCYWGKGAGTGQDASPASGAAEFTAFKENCVQQTRQMVRAFRNSPSVIMWSLTHEPTGGALNCNDLHKVAQSLDETRPTCVITNFVGNGLHGEENINGSNGNTPLQGAKPVLWAQLLEKEEVTRPGEYNAATDNQAAYLLGAARWAAFDYGTHEDWVTSVGKAKNMVGMCDNYRIPKRRFYYYRNKWLGTAAPTWPQAGTPAKIKLTSDQTKIYGDGTEDCQLMVTVLDAQNNHINNSVDVTLKVTSGSGLFPTGDSINLKTIDGLAAMECRSYTIGATTIKATSTGLEGSEISFNVVKREQLTNIQFKPSNKSYSGKTRLSIKSLPTNMGTRIKYNIIGNLSLSKKPVFEIFAMNGKRIAQIKLKDHSGIIQLNKLKGYRISTGVCICRLSYGKHVATVKSIILN